MGAFAKAVKAKVQGDDVVFVLERKGVKANFEISGDALRRHFGAVPDGTGSDLLEAFERGSSQIEAVARKCFNAPNDGVIELGSGDFDDAAQVDRPG